MSKVTHKNNIVQIVYIDKDVLQFNDGSMLYSIHERDCCERHYLDFSRHSLSDFAGMNFDLSSPDFFEKVVNFGIRLLPLNGHPIEVPGYGYNNGYYSSNLELVLERPGVSTKFDISRCQVIHD